MNNQWPAEKMAVISTVHVPFNEANLIPNKVIYEELPAMVRDEGWLMAVCLRNAIYDHGLTATYTVLDRAAHHGFDWVLFDCDGAIVSDLEDFGSTWRA